MALSSQPKKGVKPLGKSLGWSEADIELASRITVIDQAEADTMFRQANPGELETLLYATPEEEELEV